MISIIDVVTLMIVLYIVAVLSDIKNKLNK
jgi:Tfp pilus assembly major pilin PilA